MKQNNIHIKEVSEGEGRAGIEDTFEEVMMENFANLVKEKDSQEAESSK